MANQYRGNNLVNGGSSSVAIKHQNDSDTASTSSEPPPYEKKSPSNHNNNSVQRNCTTFSCSILEKSRRCTLPGGHRYSLSESLQKVLTKLRLKIADEGTSATFFACDLHQKTIEVERQKAELNIQAQQKKRKLAEDAQLEATSDLGLQNLSMNTLKRCKKFFKLPNRANSKAQLVEQLSDVLKDTPINAKETIAYFIYAVKNNKNQLDTNENAAASTSQDS